MSCTLAFFFVGSAYGAGGIGVKPLVIDLQGKPGVRLPFEINLYSTSPTESASASFTFSDPVQNLNGSIAFKKPGENPNSCVGWIKFDQQDVTVPAGKELVVKGLVSIPRTANGTYLTTVMVNQKGLMSKDQVKMGVRYAVVIRIQVKGRKVRTTANIDEITVLEGEDGPILQALVTNKSIVKLPIYAQATVQDSKRRTVARLDMLSAAAKGRKEGFSHIYPGAQVALQTQFDTPLPPGEYTAQVMIKGEKRRFGLQRKQFSIVVGDFPAGQPVQTGTILEPGIVEFILPAGAGKGTALTLTNNEKHAASITLSLSGVEGAPSSLDWWKLKGGTITLDPGKSRRVPLRLQIPRNIAPGGYFARIMLDNGKEKKAKAVLAVVVPGEGNKLTMDADAFTFTGLTEGMAGFALKLVNTGNIHLRPQAKAHIFNAKNKKIEKISLVSTDISLLPGTSSTLIGKSHKRLAPGDYKAEATIAYRGAKQPVKKVVEFTVE